MTNIVVLLVYYIILETHHHRLALAIDPKNKPSLKLVFLCDLTIIHVIKGEISLRLIAMEQIEILIVI